MNLSESAAHPTFASPAVYKHLPAVPRWPAKHWIKVKNRSHPAMEREL